MGSGGDVDQRAGLAWQVGGGTASPSSTGTRSTLASRLVDGVMARAALRPGERVLDLGTGTGAVAAKAAAAVGSKGSVLATDPSPEMVVLARRRAGQPGIDSFQVEVGKAEAIPAVAESFDAVLASLSLMYVIDRAAAAGEIARVLRREGRLVAAVWGGPDVSDIVLFQQTGGTFAPPPPVRGVGPGALADARPFLEELSRSGIEARVETEVVEFEFDSFDAAWEVLAGVTTADLPRERQEEAKAGVQAAMWPEPHQPRRFRNTVQFITGTRS